MPFLYETHAHTSEVSRCSRMDAKSLVRYFWKRSYDGIFITDHFFNGNTVVPKDLPWEQRVSIFTKGYETAKEEGDKLGISVFFAWEYTNMGGTDFLTYGLDQEWLLRHEDCLDVPFAQYAQMVHAAGGIVIQAHPFREANYIPMICLAPRDVDGVETENACRTKEENARADWYADSYSLLKFAGSDIHFPLKRHCGIITEEKIKSTQDMIRIFKKGKFKCFSKEE